MRALEAAGTAFLVAVTVACSAPLPSAPPPAGPEAACFETAGWRLGGDLSVRTEGEGDDALLFRLVPRASEIELVEKISGPGSAVGRGKIVYRYRRGERDLEITDLAAWDRAGGTVGDCQAQQLLMLRIPFSLDTEHDSALRFNDRIVPTAGKGVVAMAVSPGRRTLAVLSSEIPPVEGMLFGSHGSGRHYHQIFRIHDGATNGEKTLVPLNVEKSQIDACWSADQRHVLYCDISHTRLCVIPAPQ